METLAARADLLDTTSPSVLTYAALDGWRRQMVEHGRELLDNALSRARRVRAEIENIEGLHVNDREDFCHAHIRVGVESFTHSLRAETASCGVSVGIAYLNWIDTDMIRDADR